MARKVIHDVAVEVEHPGLILELVAAEEREAPGAVLIVVIRLLPDLEGDGPGGGVAHRGGLGEDLLHPLVRRERLALLDADRGIEAEPDRVEGIARLLLHDLIEQLPEGVIRRGDRVEMLAGEVHELHRRRIGGLGQRINPRELLHQVHARLRVAVDQEAAPGDPVAERRRAHDDVALRHLALVAGRQQQVLPALALVRPGDADIDDPAVPHVVYGAEHLRRHLDDQRAVAEIEPRPAVDGVVIGGEEDRPRVHQLLEDRHGGVCRSQLADGVAIRRLAHRGQRQE